MSRPLSDFLLILSKELTCCLRDSDVLIYGVFFPLLLYPFAIVVSTEILTWQKGMNEIHKTRVTIVKNEPGRYEALTNALKGTVGIELVDSSDPDGDLLRGTVDGVIDPVTDSHDIEIRTSNSDQFIMKASETIEQLIANARADALAKSLKEKGLPIKYIEPYHEVVQSLEGHKAKATALQFPKELLGMLFLAVNCTLAIQALLVAGSAATCLLALEREKKTIATTLLLPVERSKIMLAKFVSVVIASVASGLINATGFAATMIVMTFAMFITTKSTSVIHILRGGILPQPEQIVYGLAALISISKTMPGVFLSIFGLPTLENILLIPFVQVTAVSMATSAYFALAANCKSYKEAQVLLTIPMSVCVFLPFLCCLPGFDLTNTTALIPLANLFLLLKPGYPALVTTVLAFAVNIVLMLCFLSFATATFMREEGQDWFKRPQRLKEPS